MARGGGAEVGIIRIVAVFSDCSSHYLHVLLSETPCPVLLQQIWKDLDRKRPWRFLKEKLSQKWPLGLNPVILPHIPSFYQEYIPLFIGACSKLGWQMWGRSEQILREDSGASSIVPICMRRRMYKEVTFSLPPSLNSEKALIMWNPAQFL